MSSLTLDPIRQQQHGRGMQAAVSGGGGQGSRPAERGQDKNKNM